MALKAWKKAYNLSHVWGAQKIHPSDCTPTRIQTVHACSLTFPSEECAKEKEKSTIKFFKGISKWMAQRHLNMSCSIKHSICDFYPLFFFFFRLQGVPTHQIQHVKLELYTDHLHRLGGIQLVMDIGDPFGARCHGTVWPSLITFILWEDTKKKKERRL